MTEKQRFAAIRNRHRLSFRRYLALIGNGDCVRDYTGMNCFELRDHISSMWQLGMNWDNYGTVWVVDHVVALKYFDPTNHSDMKQAWHYSNLRPLFFNDNHAKGYCVEVTTNVLEAMPKHSMVSVLIDRMNTTKDMFKKYY